MQNLPKNVFETKEIDTHFSAIIKTGEEKVKIGHFETAVAAIFVGMPDSD